MSGYCDGCGNTQCVCDELGDMRECWTAELDDGTEVLVETFDRVTFTIASRPRPLRGLPWSPPIRLEPQQ